VAFQVIPLHTSVWLKVKQWQWVSDGVFVGSDFLLRKGAPELDFLEN
jgi:hypothetical protein